MLAGRSVVQLEHDYQALLKQVRELPKDRAEKVRAYLAFVRKHSHLLALHPSALVALAHAQPLDSPVLQDARQRFNDGPHWPWFRLLYPAERDRNPALLRTIQVGSEVHAVANVEMNGVRKVLSGTGDGTL